MITATLVESRAETARRRAAWLVGLAALIGGLAANPTAGAAMPMHFEHVSIEDGLSQNNVQAILQDSVGYMWFGTESGLNRYNGYEVKSYHRSRADASGLASDFIWRIAEDEERNLWLATEGGGLVRWNRDSDTFTSFRHDPGNAHSLASDDIRSLLVNDDGTLWVGTRDQGLDLFDPDTGSARHFRHDPGDRRSISDDHIYALLRDAKGNLWIGTDGGVNRLLPGSRVFQRYQHDADDPKSLSGNSVRSIYEDSAGVLWVGTEESGLNRLRSLAGEFSRFGHDPGDPVSLSDNHVRVVFEDDARRLWVGTADGLNLLHREDGIFDRYRHAPVDSRTLNDSYVNSIFQDRSGLLWIGTRSAGVSKWNPRSWSLGPYAQPWLSDADVTSFASDGRGTVWVGTLGAGLARLDESTGELERYRHRPEDSSSISDDRVMSLLIDRNGILWIGTMAGGLNRMDRETGALRVYRHDPDDPHSIAGDGVMTIHEDRSGRIWVGTYGDGLSVFDPATERFTRFLHDPADPASLSDSRVSAILEAGDGSLWIGTFGGLNLLRPDTGTFRRFRNVPEDSQSLAGDMIYALHEDSAGSVWVGTAGGGLDRILRRGARETEVRFENVSRADGLPSNVIYGIQSDAAGHLWLSTNYGLARLDRETGTVKAFHRSHGLQGEEFNYGASHRGPGGRLYFGGAGGFNAFLPELVEDNGYKPPIVLTSVHKLGQPAVVDVPYDRLTELRLGHEDRVVNFGFAALDYTAPLQTTYSYRLEGFDDEWIDLGSQHHVTYTNLDAGSYLLRVRARTSDGATSSAGFSIPLMMAPAPWATSGAYLLYALLTATLLFAAWRMQRQKLIREVEYSQRLERDVAERTEELEQRNEELEIASRAKSDFLARMSHEIRTPMNGMLGMTQLLMSSPLDDKQRRFAKTIRSSAETLLDIINDILDFSKIEAGRLDLDHREFNVNDLVEETTELFSVPAGDKGLELICSTPPGRAISACGDPIRLKQILVNLIANAVKFTQDGEIFVRYGIDKVSMDRVALRFEVSDTGIGIKPESLALIFDSFSQEDGTTSRRFGGTGLGLAICQQLVDMMGGEIGVDSSLGKGSRFWFTVTLDMAGDLEVPEQDAERLSHLRALVVDDNRRTLSVVSGYLERFGVETACAATPEDALRQLHAASYAELFDVLLLDANRNVQDAVKTIEAIRRNPMLAALRIVAMTDSADDRTDWLSTGADAWLPKPLRQAALYQTLVDTTGSYGTTERLQPLDPGKHPGLAALGGRVLLVEDNPVNQTVAVGMLEEFGCDTVVAFNGEDAIAQMAKNDFDVVLMDCEMPVMDGFAATAAIRERAAGREQVPIIAVTANAVDGDRERCLQVGMQDYLAKPITVENLHGTLKKWLPKDGGAEPAAEEPNPLDGASLDSIRNLQGVGGEKMVRKVVRLYLSSSAPLMDSLREGVERSDAEQIRQAAHAIKSSSQNVGAKRLASLCQRMEEMGRNREVAGTEPLLGDIESAYLAAAEALRAQLRPRAH